MCHRGLGDEGVYHDGDEQVEEDLADKYLVRNIVDDGELRPASFGLASLLLDQLVGLYLLALV